MEAVSSTETSDLTIVRRRNIPEDAILHSHGRENLKSYLVYPLYVIDNVTYNSDEGGTKLLRNVVSYKSHTA
jgi:hypothetical protein